MPAVIGVLGGMGPAAGVHFQRRLIELTPASRDSDHPRVVVWTDPSIPDRVAALRGDGESPVPALRHGYALLRSAGATVVAVPCNTVHPFLSEALGADSYVDMISSTAEQIRTEHLSRVGVLATSATLEHGIYDRALASHGIEAVHPADQDVVLGVIAAVKAGEAVEPLRKQLMTVIEDLTARGCDGVLLGCTELSVLAPGAVSVPIIDALDVLARKTLERAGISPRS